MTDASDTKDKKPLTLARPSAGAGTNASSGRLELKKTVETGKVRQSFSHGRSKTVTVEVKKKRTIVPVGPADRGGRGGRPGAGALTQGERAARVRALQEAIHSEEEIKRRQEAETLRLAREEARRQTEEEVRRRQEEDDARRKAEVEARRAEEEARRKADEESRRKSEEMAARRLTPDAAPTEAPAAPAAPRPAGAPSAAAAAEAERAKRARVDPRKTPPRRGDADRRRPGKLTVTQALVDDGSERMRSLASVRRARERERLRAHGQQEASKIVREVVVPETVTVQDLANRMAERGVDVVKALMRMGVMATINQAIDADTAELVVQEFGHNVRRVAESDVEIGLKGEIDEAGELQSRPPVVTIMGHVDHGKTTLLDALRSTDVVSGEAGGITQHIGAYQVTLPSGAQITFLDTPGHEAFTAMRARGAKVTDLVILVVAADDGIMPQTIEAIRHARAAGVPMIVAINKMDLPAANVERIRNALLQHEVVLEELGGDVMAVQISAKAKLNLDKLEEAILLQAEVLELTANPDRSAEGVVVEAKLDRGRGVVSTLLVQRGTLRVGDIVVAGAEWGRVRALSDDKGRSIHEATPSMPVEVLGMNGVPIAGDDFVVVESDARAREVSEFRQRQERRATFAAGARGTVEQMLSKIAAGQASELPLVIKGDVHGSVEAIAGSLEKLRTEEVGARILHAAVGGINESDVTLANASNALVMGFNVRADAKARDLARRDGVEIRYYSIIYDIVNDVKAMLSGMLAPTVRETLIGNAQIREVFNITKVGKVAGCMVTDGMVKRGAKVRLLRDNVVIHEGKLSTLKRFKEEVREVNQGYECGMAFEHYEDIRVGDVIECFEVEEVARAL